MLGVEANAMRTLPKTLLVVVPILAIGLVASSFWFAHHLSAEVEIPTLPCLGPPTYEMPNVPCSGTDLSALANLPVVRYCDLIREGRTRNNEIVRVRGVYWFNHENSVLDDPACRNDDSWTWVEAEPYSNFMATATALKGSQRAEVVFTGRFSGPNREGFGHLNGCRYQLIVVNVDELKPLATVR
jgi:hypothetical protein